MSIIRQFIAGVSIFIFAMFALLILANINKMGEIFDEVHAAIRSTVIAVGVGVGILAAVSIVLGASYGVIRLKQMKNAHVIRDGKNGEPVRAVIYQGQLVQIMDLSAEPNLQIEHFTKLFAMAQKAAQATNRLIGDDEYEYIDEEEERPQIEQAKPANEYLNISEDYQPHADEFLSGRKLIVGVAGSGKSNSTASVCEELGRLDVPMVLADTENEYESLCDRRYLPHATRVDSRVVTVANAVQFGRHVLEQNIQAVLNLHSYEMPEAAQVMISIIVGMKQWQEERANELRIPCEFLLEEATTWLPQNVNESQLNGTEVFSRLQDAFFNDMVRKGRKRGLGLTVICQKIAEIDKRALQCDVKLLHRQTELNDLKKYAAMGITNDETLSLHDGQGYFFSSKVSKMLIQMRTRHSPHGANTPGLSELRQYQQSRNFGEKVRDFVIEEQPNGDNFRTDFEPLVEQDQEYSLVRSDSSDYRRTTVQKGVPERTKAAILGLYREGTKRKDIQGLLDLNGDEYWMVKAVCDEYDQRKRGDA